MFVYVGGESDEWVEDALENARNKNMIVVNMMEVLGDKVREEELVEGMQSDEHEHDHDEEVTEKDIEVISDYIEMLKNDCDLYFKDYEYDLL